MDTLISVVDVLDSDALRGVALVFALLGSAVYYTRCQKMEKAVENERALSANRLQALTDCQVHLTSLTKEADDLRAQVASLEQLSAELTQIRRFQLKQEETLRRRSRANEQAIQAMATELAAKEAALRESRWLLSQYARYGSGVPAARRAASLDVDSVGFVQACEVVQPWGNA